MGTHRRGTILMSVAVLFTGCTSGGGRDTPGFEPAASEQASSVTALMLRHYDHARALTSAAIFGNADRAHQSAAAILREAPVEPLPSDALPAREAFQSAVRSVERARTGAELAGTAADVARRCGDCHLSAGLGPSFTVGRIADPVTPEDHIRVLAWGSSRMWEALVAGSDLAWRAGARALSGQLLREELYASRMADPDEGRALSARMHDLGVEALSVSDRGERARILGEIWGTCSDCHELVGLGAQLR